MGRTIIFRKGVKRSDGVYEKVGEVFGYFSCGWLLSNIIFEEKV